MPGYMPGFTTYKKCYVRSVCISLSLRLSRPSADFKALPDGPRLSQMTPRLPAGPEIHPGGSKVLSSGSEALPAGSEALTLVSVSSEFFLASSEPLG